MKEAMPLIPPKFLKIVLSSSIGEFQVQKQIRIRK
jgi:hypothetical protein